MFQLLVHLQWSSLPVGLTVISNDVIVIQNTVDIQEIWVGARSSGIVKARLLVIVHVVQVMNVIAVVVPIRQCDYRGA